jgi:hypothetical protein
MARDKSEHPSLTTFKECIEQATDLAAGCDDIRTLRNMKHETEALMEQIQATADDMATGDDEETSDKEDD